MFIKMTMLTAAVFRVNYYVGAMLAQGGNLRLEDSKLVFSPTSALDRAMGAVDVEIPFKNILGMESKGALSRSVHIKTNDKTHRFEGAQAQKLWEQMQRLLPKGTSSAVAAAPLSGPHCDRCLKALQPGYFFCPFCAHRLKAVCGSCHKSIDMTWSICAFCGWKLSIPRL